MTIKLSGPARELEQLSHLLRGEVRKDSSEESRAYTKIVRMDGLVFRFFIDHRTGEGTLKVRKDGSKIDKA